MPMPPGRITARDERAPERADQTWIVEPGIDIPRGNDLHITP